MSSKSYVFTCWETPKFKRYELCEFMIWQTEKCATTGKIHWQGYIEFKKEYKLFQVKSLFKEKAMFCNIANESREKNIAYCSKDRSYNGHRVTYADCEIKEEIQDPNLWNEFDAMFA